MTVTEIEAEGRRVLKEAMKRVRRMTPEQRAKMFYGKANFARDLAWVILAYANGVL